MTKFNWLIPVLITAIAGIITIFPFLYNSLSENGELIKIALGLLGIVVSLTAGVLSFLIARKRKREANDD